MKNLELETDVAAGSGSVHRLVRHLDLFSGIGGFALACRMVGGIETVAFCEREPFAQRVLRKHWPDVPICNDIHELKGTDYGRIDLITGGFPCQPYSVAGEQRGNEDDRALWPEMLRVIHEARPRWVLGENVPGIVSMALDGVLADLERDGYACEAMGIPACGVDARHRRERVWIVAHAKRPRQQNGRAEGYTSVEQCSEAWQEAEDIRATASESSGLRRGQEWPAEPAVGRVADGIPARVDRLRGLGNAIVPQVAEEILRCMMRVDCMANISVSGPCPPSAGQPSKSTVSGG